MIRLSLGSAYLLSPSLSSSDAFLPQLFRSFRSLNVRYGHVHVMHQRMFVTTVQSQLHRCKLREEIRSTSESWMKTLVRPFSSDNTSSQLEIEKDLFRLRRKMTSHYTSGNYPEALECAKTIETTAVKLYGDKSTIYASSLNNTALMHKMKGELQEAVDNYTKALQLYEDLVGSKNENYCSVLSNIGITYKLMAQEASNDKERSNFLRHAETATVDAYALRVELKGENSKEVYDSQI